MTLYSEEGTSLIVLLITALIIVFQGFTVLPTCLVLFTSFLAFVYLVWYRKTRFENPVASMIGLIPGHYLILLALTLNDSVYLYIYPLWSFLILATLGYDLLTNGEEKGKVGKLTTMILYCIIWGVIVFLFQNLLIKGLELENLSVLWVRLGLSIGGLLWIAVGVIRIRRRFIERRS